MASPILPASIAYSSGSLPKLPTIRLNALVAFVRVTTFHPVAVWICNGGVDPFSSGYMSKTSMRIASAPLLLPTPHKSFPCPCSGPCHDRSQPCCLPSTHGTERPFYFAVLVSYHASWNAAAKEAKSLLFRQKSGCTSPLPYDRSPKFHGLGTIEMGKQVRVRLPTVRCLPRSHSPSLVLTCPT